MPPSHRPLPTYPPPLCDHHPREMDVRGFRAVCSACGSFWDLDSLAAELVYDKSYPEQRGHFDPRVGALKVRTLRRWLDRVRIQLQGRTVCEVGFGGGSCLPLLAERAAHVIGLEVNQSAIDRVRATAVRAELLLVDPLPEPSRPVDLWLFQDAFEHIPNPAPFVDWMNAHSAPDAGILMVLPRGDSLSRRLLGRLWPHKLPDHQFHWSRTGLLEFMARRGFTVEAEFYPLKFASPQMILAHMLHKLGAPDRVRGWLGGASLAVPFNLGELGVLFRRSEPQAAAGG